MPVIERCARSRDGDCLALPARPFILAADPGNKGYDRVPKLTESLCIKNADASSTRAVLTRTWTPKPDGRNMTIPANPTLLDIAAAAAAQPCVQKVGVTHNQPLYEGCKLECEPDANPPLCWYVPAAP